MINSLKYIIREEYYHLIKEIYQDEGVGDKYAQKRFNIADPEVEFEKDYQQYQKTQIKDDQNGQHVGNITMDGKHLSNIYMNPKSLENFEANVRAVSDKDGNIYVAQLDYSGYHRKITDNVPKNIGNPYDAWDNITWHRIGKTNMFGFSVSFMEYYYQQLKNPENKKIMGERMKQINNLNPTLIFMPIYWNRLIDREVSGTTIDSYLNVFNKSGRLIGY